MTEIEAGWAVLLAGLVVPAWPDDVSPAELLRGARDRRDTDAGEFVGSLLLPAGRATSLLDAVEPEDDVAVTLVPSDPGGGLAELVVVRDVLADQPWLRPVGVWLDLVADQVVTAAELTLEALEFPVPAALFLPPEVDPPSRDAVLDLLAADGAEEAGWHAEAASSAATAAFLVGCVRRRLRYQLTAGDSAGPELLNAACLAEQGADQDAVGRVLANPAPLLTTDPVDAAATRRLLVGVGVGDLGRSLRRLVPDALAAGPTDG